MIEICGERFGRVRAGLADTGGGLRHQRGDGGCLDVDPRTDLVETFGGPPEQRGCFDPIVTLAALSRIVTRPRLGTLVLCEALRPASVVAKSLASLDRVCGGRLDIGLGAGWYEPDYSLIGMEMPPPKERLETELTNAEAEAKKLAAAKKG